MKVYIMIGIAGSGKSTYINRNKKSKDIVISSDSIRGELFGDESDQSNNKMVFEIFENRLIECLKENKTCWLDSTALTRILREKQVKIIKEYNKNAKIVYVYIDKGLATALKQNKMRERRVPEEVIEAMNERLERVSLEERKFSGGRLIVV
jgi:predicted kinase